MTSPPAEVFHGDGLCYCDGVRHSLTSQLLGGFSLVLLSINTVLWCVPLYALGIAKLLVPIESWRRCLSRALMRLAEGWIDCNNLALDLVHEIDWNMRGLDGLHRDGWYLVSCNHQTWVDIPVLQRTFNRRIPFIKFFLKKELIWVPILGLAWWILDYPFMKRHSRKTLEKHPELRGEDLATTRKACERFRHTPLSILNFLEGTRFTAAKHASQRSPYRNLLLPKAGGMAFVLDAMGDSLHSLLDVTIVYPDGTPTFWDFLAGRLDRVVVHVEEKTIPQDMLGGDYLDDAAFRERFQEWVRGLWQQKDERITSLRAEQN